MQQAVLTQPGSFSLQDVALPKLSSGEARVRIHRVGICGSDLHAYRGVQPFLEYPRVLGHELSGDVVETAGDVSQISVGDRVAVEPYLNCGQCRACRVERPNCCDSLQVLGVHRDGGMGEYLTIPAHFLHPSDKLTYDQLALVETLGIGAHAVQRGQVESGEWAVVVGVGPIGLGATQFTLAEGANVIVVDVNPDRLEFIRQFGVQHTIHAQEVNAVDVIADLTGGELAHVVLDATGHAGSMAHSLEFAGHTGRVVWVGLTKQPVTIDDTLFHRRELTLFSTRNSADNFPRIIEMIEQSRIDTTPWITHRMSLEQIPARFEELLDPEAKVVKAVVSVVADT